MTRNAIGQAFAWYAAGRVGEALALVGRILEEDPPDAELLNLAGACHACLEEPEAAEAAYRRALELQPGHAEIRYNLGVLLRGQNRLVEAEEALRAALARAPEHVESLVNLGDLSRQRQDFIEAEKCYREALRLNPDHADACNHLGVLLKAWQRPEAAEAMFRQAVRIDPDHAGACFNLGNLLTGLGRLVEAEAAFRETLRLQPRHVGARVNLGNLLAGQHRFAEAGSLFRQAMALQPREVALHGNLGNLLREQKRFREAEAVYLQALGMRPDHGDTLWNLSLLYLARGRFREGWPLYEARYHPDKSDRRVVPIEVDFPMWRGESLAGRSLLILPEQGYGDQIQFCRYLPAVRELGVSFVTLVCPAPLADLFASLSGVDRLLIQTPGQSYPVHDFWCFLLSMPGHLPVIPATFPYLRPPPERVALWRSRLPGQGFRVGLVWKGDPEHPNDAHRSLPDLSLLAPLWRVPDVIFISLQKGSGEEQARNPPPTQPLLHPGAALQDFADTAAIVVQLDLVITIDSAIAHLAGALATPCWLLLPAHATDWRWPSDRTDSPWYLPNHRLFMQPQPHAWSEVVQTVGAELAKVAS
ncbi:MAG: tetratricopeptide repeat protein [Magnetococcales bacterium]|nr:tetratricopeptide repeat protein [Magnetococcales bacterium]